MPRERRHRLPQGGPAKRGTAAKRAGPVTGISVGTVQDPDSAASEDPAAFYSSVLHPDELADLLAHAGELSLDDEIACARVALRRVLAVLNTAPPAAGEDDQAPEPALSPAEFARLAALAFQGTRSVARLLRDRRAIRGDAADGISAAIAQALDELSTEWGIEL